MTFRFRWKKQEEERDRIVPGTTFVMFVPIIVAYFHIFARCFAGKQDAWHTVIGTQTIDDNDTTV